MIGFVDGWTLHDTAVIISPYSRWQSTRNPFLQRVSNCPVVSRLHHSCDQVAIVHKLDRIAASCLWFILVLTPFILKRTPDQVLSRNKLERFRNLGSFTIFSRFGDTSLYPTLSLESTKCSCCDHWHQHPDFLLAVCKSSMGSVQEPLRLKWVVVNSLLPR